MTRLVFMRKSTKTMTLRKTLRKIHRTKIELNASGFCVHSIAIASGAPDDAGIDRIIWSNTNSMWATELRLVR